MTRNTATPLFILAAWLAGPAAAPAQVVTVLHNFGGPNDGRNPNGSLLLSGGAFYGMTEIGPGFGNNGTIFKMNPDGTGFVTLHIFTGGLNDGAAPTGSLIQSGSFLYGLTPSGGSGGHGTIFRTNLDGTGFTIVHSFAGGPVDGAGPLGTLTVVGSTLYGTTSSGGSVPSSNGLYPNGTIFKVNLDGTGYAVLHNFAGGPGDGQSPGFGALAVSGSTVYGMTTVGGGGSGTIFRMNLDGSGYSILHSFVNGPNDGAAPQGQLVVSGTTLYGMSGNGGASNMGALFKMQTDGSGFTMLRGFAGTPNDGATPGGEPTIVGSTIYATTGYGGKNSLGMILGVGTDGTNYDPLYSFSGAPTDGNGPVGDLVAAGSAFYGMTSSGGALNDGTIYGFSPVPEPSSLVLLTLAAAGRVRWGGLARRGPKRPDCGTVMSLPALHRPASKTP